MSVVVVVCCAGEECGGRKLGEVQRDPHGALWWCPREGEVQGGEIAGQRWAVAETEAAADAMIRKSHTTGAPPSVLLIDDDGQQRVSVWCRRDGATSYVRASVLIAEAEAAPPPAKVRVFPGLSM